LALAFFAVVFLRAAAAGIALAFLGSVIACSSVVDLTSDISILLSGCLRMDWRVTWLITVHPRTRTSHITL
jgi:uncharacterized membrane protein